MDVNLTDIFEVVLKSAITAQYEANKYSAEIAQNQKKEPPIVFATGDGSNKTIANPYFPIPNSNFQGIGVNFKVKLEDIKTDVKRSQTKIFQEIQSKLGYHLPQFTKIIAFARSEKLSKELFDCKLNESRNMHDTVVEYYSAYLFFFDKKLKHPLEDEDKNYQQLAEIEASVFKKTKRHIENNKEIQDSDFEEIHHTVKSIAFAITPLKNIRLSILEGDEEKDYTASIDMNIDMRTFSWQNYGTE
jgi:hypothetical protein